jgi:hypothetical protein
MFQTEELDAMRKHIRIIIIIVLIISEKIILLSRFMKIWYIIKLKIQFFLKLVNELLLKNELKYYKTNENRGY